MRTISAFPICKMYQNVKKSSLLPKIVNDNVTLFMKGLNYLKDWLFTEKNQYIIHISGNSQRHQFETL